MKVNWGKIASKLGERLQVNWGKIASKLGKDCK